MQFDADFFSYRNLVRVTALLYSVKETGRGSLVPVFDTGFWIVCDGPKTPPSDLYAFWL